MYKEGRFVMIPVKQPKQSQFHFFFGGLKQKKNILVIPVLIPQNTSSSLLCRIFLSNINEHLVVLDNTT